MALRPYQQLGLDQINEQLSRGIKKILYVGPTGSGKTVLFCHIIKKSVEQNAKVLFAVKGRKLVDQASKRLFREGVQHGVFMANHWNFKPHLSTQICSIDTVIRRNYFPQADVLIIDEAHLAGDGKFKEFIKEYARRNVIILGFTATPYVKKGLRHLADEIVRPIKMNQLIAQGDLVPFRYFAPSEPDLRGVRINPTTKDYDNNELERRSVSGALTGKIIDHWINRAEQRPTLFFGVNVRHSKLIAERFVEAGVRAEHCDAETPERERDAILKRHQDGITKIICNVGIYCTGVDLPYLGAIIGARATQSYNLYIQQAGRGTRTHATKKDCLYFDHAGNIKRHGFPTDEPDCDLDGTVSDATPKEFKTCEECFAIYPKKYFECPECGHKKEAPERTVDLAETNDELVEVMAREKTKVEIALEKLELERIKFNRKNGWQFHKLLDLFPVDECKPYLPAWFLKIKGLSDPTNPFIGAPFSK